MDFANILDDLYTKINECRIHPKETAHTLQQLRNHYQGNVFKQKYKTREGQKALNNLIQDLYQRQPALKRLKWSFALHMAADQQASLLGSQGLYTTEGDYRHVTLPERVKNYAIIKGRISQIYQFGGKSADQILQQLLIDDGLSSRKRRGTLLDPIFNYIGVGSCFHSKNQICTVIILAEDIISLVAPNNNGQYIRRGLPTAKQNSIKLTEQVVLNLFGQPNSQFTGAPNNQSQVFRQTPLPMAQYKQIPTSPINQSIVRPIVQQNLNQSRQSDNLQQPMNQSIQSQGLQNPMNQSIQSQGLQNPLSQSIQSQGLQNPMNQSIQSQRIQEPLIQSISQNQFQPTGNLQNSRNTIQQSGNFNPNLQVIPPPQNNFQINSLQSQLGNIRNSNVSFMNNSQQNLIGSGVNNAGQTVLYNTLPQPPKMDQSNVINQQYSIRQQPSLSQSEVEKQYQFYSQSQNPSVNLAGSQQNTNLNNANSSGNFVLENNANQSINSTNPNIAIVPTPPDIPTVPQKKSACHIM